MILNLAPPALLRHVNAAAPGFCYLRRMTSPITFSHAEVTSISPLGFWLQFRDEELYLPFVEFPWFEHATVAQICRVECPSATRLYWPALDLDFSLEAIRNPLAFPHSGSGDAC